MTDWRALPKIELHLHLEGAAPPELVRARAAEKGVALEGVFDAGGGYAWADFDSFLACYMRAAEVFDTPEAYRRLTEAVLARSAADGVIYTEFFVCPDLCGGGDSGAWAEHVAAIAEAAAAAQGIEARVIATAIRNLGPERALRAADLAAGTGGIVTGFGMAGQERYGRIIDYTDAFELARAAGLGLTAHAGEFAGPASVWGTLRQYGVSRLGHGVRAIEDADLVAHLAETGVVLEVNPGSNIALGLYPDLASHPIDRLRRAGVAVTVSTDDPPFFRTDLPTEYARLAETFGWGAAEFREINLTAARAAFCDAATRARLAARLETGETP